MSTLLKSSRHGWFVLPALLLACAAGAAAEKAATVVAGDGPPAILLREGQNKPWKFVNDKDALAPGNQLIGGLGATIASANGAVEARFFGNLAQLSPFPILETSIVLQEATDADFAFEMDRGRIDLINHKKSGAAKIKVTVQGRIGEVTLTEPGTRLVIEMYGRWPKGVRFTKTPKETDVPALALVLMVAHGEVQVKGSKDHAFTIKAPPGPALLVVNSFGDEEPLLRTIEKVPEWVDGRDPELMKKAGASVKRFRELAEKSSIGEALLQISQTDDEAIRRLAMILLGATDDLEHLGMAFVATKHPDVHDNGILVLRHWIGRSPGQDLKLYNALMQKAGYKPAEAEHALQLLHSFGANELDKPETYETLIDFFDSERPLIRALAHWHLIRLVRAGKKIDFMATAPKEERDKAIKAWHDLIPEGTVPGHTKEKQEK